MKATIIDFCAYQANNQVEQETSISNEVILETSPSISNEVILETSSSISNELIIEIQLLIQRLRNCNPIKDAKY